MDEVNAFRGATWVSLHNGGGVGWGEVINGGFGLKTLGLPSRAVVRAKTVTTATTTKKKMPSIHPLIRRPSATQ